MRKKTTLVTNTAFGAWARLPDGDITKINWTEGVGDGDGDAWDELDDGIATYWGSADNDGAALSCKMGNGTAGAPPDTTSVWVRWTLREVGGAMTVDLIVRDTDGTLRFSEAMVVVHDDFQGISRTIDLSAITDWTAPRVEIQPNAAASRSVDVSSYWMRGVAA